MRDYVAEVRALIDTETARGPYVPAHVADTIVHWLRAHDPELLHGFLQSHAVRLIHNMINERDRSIRSHVRAHAGRSTFRQALIDYGHGDTAALNRWLTMPIVVADNVRKPLSDLTADDLTYAADRYHDHAQRNAMMSAFLRALAAKVGNGTVGDQFTDDQLSAMWQSLS